MGGRSKRDDGRTDDSREGPHLGGGGGDTDIAFSEQAAIHPQLVPGGSLVAVNNVF